MFGGRHRLPKPPQDQRGQSDRPQNAAGRGEQMPVAYRKTRIRDAPARDADELSNQHTDHRATEKTGDAHEAADADEPGRRRPTFGRPVSHQYAASRRAASTMSGVCGST